MDHSEGAGAYSKRGMYPSPESLPGLFSQRCEKRQYQKQHPCELSGHHGRILARKNAMRQTCGGQQDAVERMKSCETLDPGMFLSQFCTLQRCKDAEYQQHNRYQCQNFSQDVQNKVLRSFSSSFIRLTPCDYNRKKEICKDPVL